MARVIKFRAWNKKMKIMKEVFAINMTVPCYSVGVHLENPTWFEDEIELMQFTGLLDKNGKEIYEGDILRRKDGTVAGWVEYDGGCPLIFHSKTNSDYITKLNFFEIIGNIYESPELLTEEKEK